MRSRFHQELDDLRARLLRMGGLAEQAVDRACQAYIDRDLNRCHQVLEGETQINLTEREIDEMAFDLLAMQQPMAVDLRFILAVTKINADLERVGDQADNIVDRMRDDAFTRLVKTMNDRPEVTRQALDALLIARNLERVADHATNIAEDVIFWVRGADVRHNVAQEAAAAQPTIPDTH